ncbi:hypothetical protein, partial [Aeromonas sp. QDB30]|uniref:hypothetical protein n=1 Tax=Aeromonas sp. QDB30 TaxID=2989831 RepID=UPI0022E83549
FGDSQFTSTLSVNFHFPKIPRRTFFVARFRVTGVLPCFPLATASKKGTLVVPHFLVRFLTGAG